MMEISDRENAARIKLLNEKRRQLAELAADKAKIREYAMFLESFILRYEQPRLSRNEADSLKNLMNGYKRSMMDLIKRCNPNFYYILTNKKDSHAILNAVIQRYGHRPLPRRSDDRAYQSLHPQIKVLWSIRRPVDHGKF